MKRNVPQHTPAGRRPQPGVNHGGFTLIELLIVVAIIAILAAIAVPNFLEAQTRAKVSRVKNDQRALAVAIQSYHVDNNHYPARHNTQAQSLDDGPPVPELSQRLPQMHVLTTPISYISSLPADVFESHVTPPNNIIDFFDDVQVFWLIKNRYPLQPDFWIPRDQNNWVTISVGPDGYMGAWDATWGYPIYKPLNLTIYMTYDPTNGTASAGNIYGGELANGKTGNPMDWGK